MSGADVLTSPRQGGDGRGRSEGRGGQDHRAEATGRGAVSFASGFSRYGDHVAFVEGNRRLSYRGLDAAVCDAVRELGSSRALVALVLERSIDSVVQYLACLAAGHPVIVTTACGLDSLLSTYDPDIVITGRSGTRTHRRRESRHHLHPDLAVLLSTSGSTGSPKLVRLSASNLSSNAQAITQYLGLRSEDTGISTLPLTYCYGLSLLHSHLQVGATLVLTDESVVTSQFWHLVDQHRVSGLSGVPHTIDLLERVGLHERHLPHLRYVTQAGGRLAPEKVSRLAQTGQANGFDLFVMYGQTEATARMGYLPPDLALEAPDAVGVAIPGGRFRVMTAGSACAGRDCASRPVADDEVGELVYEGPNVMLGYATHAGHLADGRDVTHLHTGDLARVGDDGLVRVVGRASRFAKIMGLRIDLDRVERALADGGIVAAAAGADDVVRVAVADTGAHTASAEDAVCRVTGLAPTCVRVVTTPRLPRTESGKVDYPAVVALTSSPDDARVGAGTATAADGLPAAADSTDVLGALTDAYAAVMRRDPATIAPDASFRSLGGDSMRFVALSVRVEHILGTLPDRWHERPIEALAEEAPTLTAGGRPAGGRTPGRVWQQMDTTVVLRAIAITLVVGTHAGAFYLLGGAHLLMALAGFGLARFQLRGQVTVRTADAVAHGLRRLALPVLMWFAALVVLTDTYRPRLFFATTALGPNERAPEWRYWFAESLVLLLVAVALALRSTWVRQVLTRHPVAVPAVLLGVMLAVWAQVADDAFPRSEISLPAVAWLFALGWLLAVITRQRDRVALLVALGLVVPLMYDDLSRAMLVVGGLALVALVPTIRLPRVVGAVGGPVAAASLFVYLTHYQVLPLVGGGWPGVAAALLVGVLLWAGYEAAGRWLFAWRRRPSGGSRDPRSVDGWAWAPGRSA